MIAQRGIPPEGVYVGLLRLWLAGDALRAVPRPAHRRSRWHPHARTSTPSSRSCRAGRTARPSACARSPGTTRRKSSRLKLDRHYWPTYELKRRTDSRMGAARSRVSKWPSLYNARYGPSRSRHSCRTGNTPSPRCVTASSSCFRPKPSTASAPTRRTRRPCGASSSSRNGRPIIRSSCTSTTRSTCIAGRAKSPRTRASSRRVSGPAR